MNPYPGDDANWTPRNEPLGQAPAPIPPPYAPASPAPYGQPPYYQQPPYGFAQPQQVVVVQQPHQITSGFAVSSLVTGIAGVVMVCCSFGIPSLLAIILGHVALNDTKSGAKGGRGMAVAGLILGYAGIVPAILVSIMWGIGMMSGAGNPSSTP